MILIVSLLVIIIFSYFMVFLAKRLKVPMVVALILSGLILGQPLIKSAVLEPNTGLISNIGNIALLCLMFFAGLKSSSKVIYSEGKESFVITIFGALTSFLLGFVVFFLIGYSIFVSLIVGICMSITAEATTASFLIELKKLKTRVASIIIDAGIFDDILGFSLFIIITYLFKEAYIKEDILLALIIVAFFVGIVSQRVIDKSKNSTKTFEKMVFLIIVPFFFISMGLDFNLDSLKVSPFLVIVTIVVAIIGKLFGTLLTKPFTKLSFKKLHLIGWAMNSRGAVGLALALIAFKTALLPLEVYSNIVVMTLVTTLIFPFVITSMIKKNPKIMD